MNSVVPNEVRWWGVTVAVFLLAILIVLSIMLSKMEEKFEPLTDLDNKDTSLELSTENTKIC